MALATLDDRTPTTAKAIEAHYWALDPRIRAKRDALQAQREGAHAIVDALRLKLHTLREELVTKRRRLSDAIANASPELSHGESDPRGAAAIVTTGGFPQRLVREQEVARLAENLKRAEAAYQSAEERWTASARVAQNCHEWLEATPIAVIVPVVIPFARVADPRVELETIRAKIAALAREAEAVERAPVPTSEALQRLEALAREVAAQRATRITERARAFFSRDGVRSVEALFGLMQGFAEHPRELADALRERCETDFLAEQKAWKEAVRAQAVNGDPVSSSARPQRLAAISHQRHELEQREEAIVLAGERDDLQLDRRADASPAVVVCTVLDDAAAA